ncbi:hypothetical protein LTR10_000401 [Elasticomyces elasticus]|nr:hypothetical protein LTR10_000401 [Elasticomyces elasticus]KAK4980348.1 hypothetical protein LTR42_000655 [Elasticomyces elasticus]
MSDTTIRRRYPKSMENKENVKPDLSASKTTGSPMPSEPSLLEKDILNDSLTIDLLMMLKRAAYEYLMRQIAIISRPKRTKTKVEPRHKRKQVWRKLNGVWVDVMATGEQF